MKMTFGKYCGWPLEEIPTGYLQWLIEGCDYLEQWPYLRCAVLDQLRLRRDAERRAAPAAAPPSNLADQVAQVFRELSLKHHPDRGGSNAAMKVVNEFYERLRQIISV
jgi:hypothetical protein